MAPSLSPQFQAAAQQLQSRLIVSKDHLSVLLPSGTFVSAVVSEWNFDDFKGAIQSWGFVGEPRAEDFQLFWEGVQAAVAAGAGTESDLILLRGTPPLPPQEGRIEWLNSPPIPTDLAVVGRPFLRVLPPSPSTPGLTVYGKPIEPPASEVMPDPLEMTFTDGVVQNVDGTYHAEVSGQVRLERTHIVYTKNYVVTDTSLPEYRDAEFPCDVLVNGDLAGTMKWRIYGSLTVKGHWSAPHIEVHGNAVSESGVATGNEGVVKVYGSLKTTYVQFTRLGVSGDLQVDSSIVQSDVRVGGNLLCRGDPGVVMGSEVSCFGAIIANKVGSDKGRRTRIQIYKRSAAFKPPRTRIAILSKDTRMKVFGEIWTQTADAIYESPDL